MSAASVSMLTILCYSNLHNMFLFPGPMMGNSPMGGNNGGNFNMGGYQGGGGNMMQQPQHMAQGGRYWLLGVGPRSQYCFNYHHNSLSCKISCIHNVTLPSQSDTARGRSWHECQARLSTLPVSHIVSCTNGFFTFVRLLIHEYLTGL